jgi:hypothetical protein
MFLLGRQFIASLHTWRSQASKSATAPSAKTSGCELTNILAFKNQ